MYQLLDSGNGRKLEQFGDYILDRPDPQIIWQKTRPEIWTQANAVFDEVWQNKSDMPGEWPIDFVDLKLWARLTPFKHTGIFPEQQQQWMWLKTQKAKNVLNLFGYTGIAALCAAKTGAKVTYVDASKQAMVWARKNQEVSGMGDKPIRWILDDAIKFVEREVRRGSKYDAVIMDPPVFGHGPTGETWEFNKSMPQLMASLKPLLADNLAYIIINAYAVSTSHITLANILRDLVKFGQVDSGEFVLRPEVGENHLSTGIWGKWCVNMNYGR